MRTNIEIDDQLMQRAMKLSKAKTKKETVEQALKTLIQVEQQKKMLGLNWYGGVGRQPC